MPLSERTLAPAIAAHFVAKGYDIVREIELGGRRADLLAVDDSELVAIELKIRDWRPAIRQTMAYQLAADRAFVALPLQHAHGAHRARHLFDREGIGLLAVGPRNDVRTVLEATPSPRRLPPLTESVRDRLADPSARNGPRTSEPGFPFDVAEARRRLARVSGSLDV